MEVAWASLVNNQHQDLLDPMERQESTAQNRFGNASAQFHGFA